MAANGNLYFGSQDGSLYALSPDGSLRWTFSTGDWIESTPAIGPDGTIYFGGWDNGVYALNPDGGQRWKYETGSAVLGSPTVANGLVIVGSLDGFCYALDADTGAFMWAYLADTELYASPLIAQGRVYLAGFDGSVHCVDALTGNGLWSVDTANLPPAIKPAAQARIYASPVLAGDGVILVATGWGILFAFDELGNYLWGFEATAEIDSAPVIDETGKIYFGCRDGLLYCLTSDGFIEWAVDVGRVYYSSPAVGRGNLIYILGSQGGGVSRLFQLDNLGFALDTLDYNAINDASPLLTPDGFFYVGMFDGGFHQLAPANPPAESIWPLFGQSPARAASAAQYWQPYHQWLIDWFGGVDGVPEDGDRDGVGLLEEFTRGQNPTRADAVPVDIRLLDGRAEASLLQYAGALDVICRVSHGKTLEELGANPMIPAKQVVDENTLKRVGSAPLEGGAQFLRFEFSLF